MNNKEEFIERISKELKKHEWYKDYPIEECRKMAEYEYNKFFNRNKEQREITSSSYKRSCSSIKKDINNFLGCKE